MLENCDISALISTKTDRHVLTVQKIGVTNDFAFSAAAIQLSFYIIPSVDGVPAYCGTRGFSNDSSNKKYE